jgi:hypothetical protein
MSERIPPEIVGKMRAFRMRIQAGEEEWQAHIDTLIKRLTVRLANRATFRPNECIDLVRAWRTASGRQFGQKPVVDWLGDKKQFRVEEVRLTLARTRSLAWSDEAFEESICLTQITTMVDGWDADLHRDFHMLVSYSPHALVRYYQKAFHASDAALIEAMWAPMHSFEEMVRTKHGDADFAFPIPASGGHWFGTVTLFEDPKDEAGNPVLNVRTFHTDWQNEPR